MALSRARVRPHEDRSARAPLRLLERGDGERRRQASRGYGRERLRVQLVGGGGGGGGIARVIRDGGGDGLECESVGARGIACGVGGAVATGDERRGLLLDDGVHCVRVRIGQPIG